MSLNASYKQAFLPLFEHIYKNDTAAIELSFMLLDVSQIWDDLVDKDKPVSNEDIDKAFLYSLQYIPTHKYWSPAMHCMLNSVYLRWHAANKIEADINADENELSKAWMLRAALFDLFELLSLQLYGLDWAKSNARLIRQFYGETLNKFIAEVLECRTR